LSRRPDLAGINGLNTFTVNENRLTIDTVAPA